MIILGKSPILRILEEVGESPDGESWWVEAVARGLQEMSDDDDSMVAIADEATHPGT
jgi:hypothetical protein